MDIAATTAGNLYLAFMSWVGQRAEPARAGTKRRVKREDERRAAGAALIANAPPPADQPPGKARRSPDYGEVAPFQAAEGGSESPRRRTSVAQENYGGGDMSGQRPAGNLDAWGGVTTFGAASATVLPFRRPAPLPAKYHPIACVAIFLAAAAVLWAAVGAVAGLI